MCVHVCPVCLLTSIVLSHQSGFWTKVSKDHSALPFLHQRTNHSEDNCFVKHPELKKAKEKAAAEKAAKANAGENSKAVAVLLLLHQTATPNLHSPA